MTPISSTTARETRDNLLGVCAEIGAAINVNPLWIRLGFLIAVMAVSLKLTIVAYCAAAVVFRITKR